MPQRSALNRVITVPAPTPENRNATRQMTVGERIVEGARQTGIDYAVAAARARIAKRTLEGWVRMGESAIRRYEDGHDLSPTEAMYAEFVFDLEAAHADWEQHTNALLQTLAQGGIPQVTTTEKVEAIRLADGTETGNHLVERTIRTQHTLADKDVLKWMLERKRRARYGQQVAITGADGGAIQFDVNEVATSLTAEIEAYRQGLADRAEEPAQNGSTPPS